MQKLVQPAPAKETFDGVSSFHFGVFPLEGLYVDPSTRFNYGMSTSFEAIQGSFFVWNDNTLATAVFLSKL